MLVQARLNGSPLDFPLVYRFGFETPAESQRAVGFIGVAGGLYAESGGCLALPLAPEQHKQEYELNELRALRRAVELRTESFQDPTVLEGHPRLLTMLETRLLWDVLCGVEATELKRPLEEGKSLGQQVIRQLIGHKPWQRLELPKAVITHSVHKYFSRNKPSVAEATIATSIIPQG